MLVCTNPWATGKKIRLTGFILLFWRLVNGVVEKTRKAKQVSIAEAADAIGIPRMLIDIRHGKQLTFMLPNAYGTLNAESSEHSQVESDKILVGHKASDFVYYWITMQNWLLILPGLTLDWTKFGLFFYVVPCLEGSHRDLPSLRLVRLASVKVYFVLVYAVINWSISFSYFLLVTLILGICIN